MPETATTALLTMLHLCCLLLATMCDSSHRSGNFPETAFIMSCFMSVLELGSKVDTYVSYFLYAAHFWRATLSVFHLSWFCHVNNSSKTITRSFYKPGFLDWIEQNILVLAGGLNWLSSMNPQHYCFWLS